MLPFTLQQLRILKAVAKEKNFTKAAKLLYLSQPSLSKQIKILEKNLDLLLLNRTKNKISLTENGKIFLHYSERILALCEESCHALIDLKNGERGNLIIGTSQTVGTYLLPRVLTLFGQNYPQINLKVQTNSTRMIAKNISNKEIELAIVGGIIPYEFKKKLTIKHFVDDEFKLIVARSHPWAKKKKITKEDLYYLNFITLNSNSTIQRFMNNILLKHKIDPNQLKIIMQLNSIEGVKTAVNLGLGAAFVSSSAIEKEIKLKTIEIIKIKNVRIVRTISLISNRESYKSKGFKYFYTEILKLKNNLEN